MTALSRRRFLSLALTGLPLALAGCSAGGAVVMQTVRATPVSSVSVAEAQAALNAMRSERGLAPLTHNVTLQRIAEEQAQIMAHTTRVAHTSEPGETLILRIRRAGFGGGAGENLAGGPPNLAAAIDGWLKSPAHHAVMVNPDYVQFGIAMTRGPSTPTNTYGTYWALLMGVKSPPGQP